MSNPTYPTLPIDLTGSKANPRDGREEDTSGDGTTRVRKLHADRMDFEIKHGGLTAAQVSTLESFYTTNGTAAAIDFRWPVDGLTYVVRFGKTARRYEPVGTGVVNAYVRLVG